MLYYLAKKPYARIAHFAGRGEQRKIRPSPHSLWYTGRGTHCLAILQKIRLSTSSQTREHKSRILHRKYYPANIYPAKIIPQTLSCIDHLAKIIPQRLSCTNKLLRFSKSTMHKSRTLYRLRSSHKSLGFFDGRKTFPAK